METRELTISNQGGGSLEWQVSQMESINLTHSASMEVLPGHSIACQNQDGGTGVARYLRVFTLADFNISNDFHIAAVTFGIEFLSSEASITVNLYTLQGAFLFSNLTLIGTTSEALPAQTATLVTVPVTGTAPAGSTLVVEIVAPGFKSTLESFLPAMNAEGETASSYIASDPCGIFSPTTMESTGFPDRHLVMAVESIECRLPTWASVTRVDGLVLGGGSQVTNVTFDTAGMSPGDFQTNLCVGSNDTTNPLTAVPLVMRVTEVSTEITVAPQMLDFGDVPLGQPAAQQMVIVDNLGPGDLMLGTLAFEGAAAADFSLPMDACSNQILAAGEFCGAEVGFTPSAVGLRAARLRIPSNAAGNPHFVDLTGSSGVLFADGFEN